jgi:hypothetical protein
MYELDAAGAFVCDIVELAAIGQVEAWTNHPLPQPCVAPRYVGGEFDPVTRERFGGHWQDPGEELSAAEIEQALVSRFNDYLDSVAAQRRYDTRWTCALRAGYPGAFQAEGQVFAAWMDSCNMIAYAVMADVKAGRRAVPTPAELLALMPQIQWPPSPIPEGAV